MKTTVPIELSCKWESTIFPVMHIRPEDRDRIISGYPAHEREARSRGEPMLGSGRIYTTPEAAIVEDTDPVAFPSYWRWGAGLDFGIQHSFGYVLACHDPDTDTIHLVAELCMSDATIANHVQAIKDLERRIFGRHMHIPISWPHDGGVRDRTSGEPLQQIYKRFGLRMLAEPACHAGMSGSAKFSLEGGIQEIDAREQSGKWRVARGMVSYLSERRLYHRRDGVPVPIKDDVLAAARYAAMMRRYFKVLDYWRPAAGSVAPAATATA